MIWIILKINLMGYFKMMSRTHIAISAFVILLFFPHVSHKITFPLIALVATYLPDIDSAFSVAGRYKASRFVQFFVKHRGFLHSFTFCALASLLLALIHPMLALPFFLGYGMHLFADTFTVEGIKPFWPSKRTSRGRIMTGSLMETNIFVAFLIFDVIVLIMLVRGIF